MNKLRSLTISGLRSAGFTMIELLIVISILGILAVAVLSAINPVEQINRGRDTGSQSDAEQLISAIDRYQAFQGYYPWQSNPAADTDTGWFSIQASNWGVDGGSTCNVLTRLGSTESTATGCVNTNEVKSAFISRITSGNYNSLHVFNEGDTGNSTYVCFKPLSDAFNTKAIGRCNADDEFGALPPDFPDATGQACDDGEELYCLP